MAVTFFMLAMLVVGLLYAHGADRCQDYVIDVRSAHTYYLGSNYPYQYGVGVMKAESLCRSDARSFDGGLGLYQITPSTGIGKELEREIPGINYFNPEHSIRAGAFYTAQILNKHLQRGEFKFKGKYSINPKSYVEDCGVRLADVYQFYNGGYWFIYEASKTDTCDRAEMRANCKRGGVWVGKRYLNFCDINYSYPRKVYDYGQAYKITSDRRAYW